jgi:ABC-type polysaccharide/polyol phosphate transport system ATPase subunit
VSSLSVSSETPADRPSASSEDPAEVRPRRAIEPGDAATGEPADPLDQPTVGEQPDDLPGSPSTPVRLRDRLAQRARRSVSGDPPDAAPVAGTPGAGNRWSWDLPASEDEQPDWSAQPTSRQASDPAAGSGGGPADALPGHNTAALTGDLPETIRQLQASSPTDLLPRTGDAPGTGGGDPAVGAAPTQDFAGEATPAPSTSRERAGSEPKSPQPETSEPDTTRPDTSGPDTSGPDTTGQDQEPKATRKSGGNKPGTKARKPGKGGKAGKGGKGGKALPGRQRFKLLQDLGPRTPRTEVADQSHLPAEQRTDLAVRVTDLSITYRTSFEKKPTFRQAVVRLGRGQRAVREIKALQNISFEVRTGSSVGIIGRNGAGKSTLMRAMAGILPPTSGTVEVWGRASTLLALGVGFNNSLSGRENIILGGLAAGLPLEEVNERANEIAEWTELGDFIDMPMRTYSSGMASRVAFAVAVHMEPDILMIDEGLSTGDAHFKDKASAKMAELRDKARAMFLVSHGLGSIKELCDEAIWIDKGHLMARGEPEEVIDRYLNHLNAKRRSTAYEDL